MIKKLVISLSFALLFVLPLCVSANERVKSIVNENGVTIPYNTYEDLLKMYPENYVNYLTQEEYDNILGQNIDFDNVAHDIKYIKTDINNVTGEVTETEVSEEEYNNVDTQKEEKTRATVIETAYKKIVLSGAKSGGNNASFAFTATWKQMPATRSYDVIAARFTGAAKVNGTQSGKQFYTAGGVNSSVTYAPNGTNINNQSNGYGISMNLVDNATKIQCTTSGVIAISSYPAGIFASYQHATTNVSLATSKSYTLSNTGLGNVIKFNGNIGNYYDGMAGTNLYLYA